MSSARTERWAACRWARREGREAWQRWWRDSVGGAAWVLACGGEGGCAAVGTPVGVTKSAGEIASVSRSSVVPAPASEGGGRLGPSEGASAADRDPASPIPPTVGRSSATSPPTLTPTVPPSAAFLPAGSPAAPPSPPAATSAPPCRMPAPIPATSASFSASRLARHVTMRLDTPPHRPRSPNRRCVRNRLAHQGREPCRPIGSQRQQTIPRATSCAVPTRGRRALHRVFGQANSGTSADTAAAPAPGGSGDSADGLTSVRRWSGVHAWSPDPGSPQEAAAADHDVASATA
eukprot:scaffold33816_cov98-Isochrysis_galbana.AAC.2